MLLAHNYRIQHMVLFLCFISIFHITSFKGYSQNANFELTGLGSRQYSGDPILTRLFGNSMNKLPFKDCFWSTCCSFLSESPNPTRHDNWMFGGKKSVGIYTRDIYSWGYLLDTVLIAWNQAARNIVLNTPEDVIQKVFYKGRAKFWDINGNVLYNEDISTPVSSFPTLEGWMPDAYYHANDTIDKFELIYDNGQYILLVYNGNTDLTRLVNVDSTRIDFYANDHPAISDSLFEEGIVLGGQLKYADSAAYWANFRVKCQDATVNTFEFYIKIGLKRSWECDSWYTGYAVIGSPSIASIPDWTTYPEQP